MPKATYVQGLAPEKLAACLARYSRSNEGIDLILEKFADASPDAIFKFVDYGHASIGGLTGGLAIAIDQVTMLLACKLFEFAQMADGQESSTRYIKMGVDNLPNPGDLGIPSSLHRLWRDTCADGFELYDWLVRRFDHLAAHEPERLTLPEKAKDNEKLRERLVKNYGLDRARYFLPLACKTNVALTMSARMWADTVRLLDSLGWDEASDVATLIRVELEKAAPNLVRHSYPDAAAKAFLHGMLESGASIAYDGYPRVTRNGECQCHVTVSNPVSRFNHYSASAADALWERTSRYSHTGVALKRQTVQVEWSNMAIAEMRDLNRHRTGFRFSDWGPRGFYLPQEAMDLITENEEMMVVYVRFMERYAKLSMELGAIALHPYGFFLGTQIPFEHTQQADKFLYEVELRTGMGAHFRYAEHVAQAAELYFGQVPEAREFITIGNAEQE